jgi:uncharacterized protein
LTGAAARSLPLVFAAGAAVGVLGGMIGLGGAEFRLPLLIGVFGFAALAAVVVNKAISLIVVAAALPARLIAVPWPELAPHWPVAVNLLGGTLVGAWIGASWAVRMRTTVLYRVLAALMVFMAAALVATHLLPVASLHLSGWLQVVAGVAAGLVIGVVAAIMGVAGGELLIPTIVLLFAIDIKTAGSLSLMVSLPTMLVAFALQQGRQLRRPRTEPPLRPHHGHRVHCWSPSRRTAARCCPRPRPDPGPGPHPAHLCGQARPPPLTAGH